MTTAVDVPLPRSSSATSAPPLVLLDVLDAATRGARIWRPSHGAAQITEAFGLPEAVVGTLLAAPVLSQRPILTADAPALHVGCWLVLALNAIAVLSTVERSFRGRLSRCRGGSRCGTIYTIIHVAHCPAGTSGDIVFFSVSLEANHISNAIGITVTIASTTSKGSLLIQKDQFLEIAALVHAIIGIPAGFSFASGHSFISTSLIAYEAIFTVVRMVAIATAVSQKLVRVCPEGELGVVFVRAVDVIVRAALGSHHVFVGHTQIGTGLGAVLVIFPVNGFGVAVVLGLRPGLAGVERRYHLWRSLVGTADAGIRIDWVGRRLAGCFTGSLAWSLGRLRGQDLVAAYIPVISLTDFVARELTELVVLPVCCLFSAPIKDIVEIGTIVPLIFHAESFDVGTLGARGYGGGLGRRAAGCFARSLAGSFRRLGGQDLVAAYIPVISLANFVARELTELVVLPICCLFTAPTKDIVEIGTIVPLVCHAVSFDVSTLGAGVGAIARVALWLVGSNGILLATTGIVLVFLAIDDRHADDERCGGEGYGGLGELHGRRTWGEWTLGLLAYCTTSS